MNNKIALSVAALALAFVFATVSKTQTPTGPKHHVVFHLNEAQGPAWNMISGHVHNLKTALDKDGGVQVEVVVNGEAINMLRKTNTANEKALQAMADEGVVIAACQNSMRSRNIKPEDIFPFATPVDAGVAELARKQEAGFAYIH